MGLHPGIFNRYLLKFNKFKEYGIIKDSENLQQNTIVMKFKQYPPDGEHRQLI